MEKIWDNNEIEQLLKSNDIAVVRALMAIYNNQTSEEKVSCGTFVNNGIGFNAFDVHYLTPYINILLKGGKLNLHQIQYVRKKIIKYKGQLCKIANGGSIEKLRVIKVFAIKR
jgi:hypothetical protein